MVKLDLLRPTLDCNTLLLIINLFRLYLALATNGCALHLIWADSTEKPGPSGARSGEAITGPGCLECPNPSPDREIRKLIPTHYMEFRPHKLDWL